MHHSRRKVAFKTIWIITYGLQQSQVTLLWLMVSTLRKFCDSLRRHSWNRISRKSTLVFFAECAILLLLFLFELNHILFSIQLDNIWRIIPGAGCLQSKIVQHDPPYSRSGLRTLNDFTQGTIHKLRRQDFTNFLPPSPSPAYVIYGWSPI